MIMVVQTLLIFDEVQTQAYVDMLAAVLKVEFAKFTKSADKKQLPSLGWFPGRSGGIKGNRPASIAVYLYALDQVQSVLIALRTVHEQYFPEVVPDMWVLYPNQTSFKPALTVIGGTEHG